MIINIFQNDAANDDNSYNYDNDYGVIIIITMMTMKTTTSTTT